MGGRINTMSKRPKYLNTAMRFPWGKDREVPHCMIDICRACNISCRACYNIDEPNFKPIEEIEKELKVMKSFRKIQSVLIAGGEPLLHPEIYEIIRLIRSHDIYVEIASNAVLLNDETAQKLAQAGLNVFMNHIESEQKRPDLPCDNTGQRNALRVEKAALCAKYGIGSWIIITGFKDNPAEIEECMELFLSSKEILAFAVLNYRNTQDMGKMHGNLLEGIETDNLNYTPDKKCFTMAETVDAIGKYFNHSPYNFLGSSVDKNDPRWLTYKNITAYDDDGTQNLVLKPSLFEKIYIRLFKLLNGRNIFYLSQNSKKVKSLVFMNALFGNFSNFEFLFKNRRKKFINKTFLIQIVSEVKQGKLIHCANCPDAQIKNEKLVPTCVADNIVDTK